MNSAYVLAIAIICVIAGVISGVMLVDRKSPSAQRRITGDIEEEESIRQKLRELDQGLTDLSDRVTHWMRRSNMRQLREAKETIEEAPAARAGESKDAIRRRVFGQKT